MHNERFTWRLRVYYEDTDASGVVYHARYLQYYERARTEWLRHLGFEQDRLMQEFQIAFTIASLQTEFSQPARLDDELDVSVEVIRCGRASMLLAQQICDTRDADRRLSSLQCKIGCVNTASFRPVAMPAAIVEEVKHVC